MKKLLICGVVILALIGACSFFFGGEGGSTQESSQESTTNAFKDLKEIKLEIVSQYMNRYKNFKLGTIESLQDVGDGYIGVIKFTYDDNKGNKMVRVNNFETDKNGHITKIDYDTTIPYKELQSGVIPEIK